MIILFQCPQVSSAASDFNRTSVHCTKKLVCTRNPWENNWKLKFFRIVCHQIILSTTTEISWRPFEDEYILRKRRASRERLYQKYHTETLLRYNSRSNDIYWYTKMKAFFQAGKALRPMWYAACKFTVWFQIDFYFKKMYCTKRNKHIKDYVWKHVILKAKFSHCFCKISQLIRSKNNCLIFSSIFPS